ncbi:MAG: 50S ribosomal protein L22 [bacterium]|nr:50S ribosomal protein L22 [bacterium]
MEARCVARFVRVTPQKMRMVAGLVRGKTVSQAIDLLHFAGKPTALPMEKALRSALANLMNKEEARGVDADIVRIAEINVQDGPSLKRWLPRAQGRATPIIKRSCHIFVRVEEDPKALAKRQAEEAAKRAARVKRSKAKKEDTKEQSGQE